MARNYFDLVKAIIEHFRKDFDLSTEVTLYIMRGPLPFYMHYHKLDDGTEFRWDPYTYSAFIQI